MLRLRPLALVASLALLGAGHRPATIFDLGDRIGRHAPAISLPADDGTRIAFGDLRGKPTYVFLFASWCGPCRESLPFVRADFARYGDRVRFIGVDVLDETAAAHAAIAAAGLPFPVALYPIEDLDALISPSAQLSSGTKYRIPIDVLIDAGGVVRYAWHGLAVDGSGDPVDVLPSYLAKLGVE